MAKELTTKESLDGAIKAMAGERAVDSGFEITALLDLNEEIQRRIKSSKTKAIADLQRQQTAIAAKLKQLGVGGRGRPQGAKNKPKAAGSEAA